MGFAKTGTVHITVLIVCHSSFLVIAFDERERIPNAGEFEIYVWHAFHPPRT